MSYRIRPVIRSTISKKSFSVDDEIDDSPLLKVEFCTDFLSLIPPEIRQRVGIKMLEYGMRVLEEEARAERAERPKYNPSEGF
jgi:hypothetical protein